MKFELINTPRQFEQGHHYMAKFPVGRSEIEVTHWRMIDHKKAWQRQVKESRLEPIIWGCIMGTWFAYCLAEYL